MPHAFSLYYTSSKDLLTQLLRPSFDLCSLATPYFPLLFQTKKLLWLLFCLLMPWSFFMKLLHHVNRRFKLACMQAMINFIQIKSWHYFFLNLFVLLCVLFHHIIECNFPNSVYVIWFFLFYEILYFWFILTSNLCLCTGIFLFSAWHLVSILTLLSC